MAKTGAHALHIQLTVAGAETQVSRQQFISPHLGKAGYRKNGSNGTKALH